MHKLETAMKGRLVTIDTAGYTAKPQFFDHYLSYIFSEEDNKIYCLVAF